MLESNPSIPEDAPTDFPQDSFQQPCIPTKDSMSSNQSSSRSPGNLSNVSSLSSSSDNLADGFAVQKISVDKLPQDATFVVTSDHLLRRISKRRRSSRRNSFQAGGVSRFFNNVLSAVASVAVITLLYLNYHMFETYMGEFLVAFIFSEAFWDTKKTITKWLDVANSAYARPRSEFSLRRNILRYFAKALHFNKISKFTKISDFLSLLSMSRDSSSIYLQIGIAMIACAVKPEAVITLSAVFVLFLFVVIVLDNRLLFLCRIHHTLLGMSNDTFAAALILIGLLWLGLMLGISFGAMISRDVKEIIPILTQFVEDSLQDDGWMKQVLQQWMPKLQDAVTQYADVMENSFMPHSSFQQLVTMLMQVIDPSTANQSPLNPELSPEGSDLTCSVDNSFEQVLCAMRDLGQEFMHSAWSEFVSEGASASALGQVGVYSLSFLVSASTLTLIIVDIGFRLVFFFTILFLLLSSTETIVESLFATSLGIRTTKLSSVLHDESFSEDEQEHEETLIAMFEREVQISMEAVLILPMKLCLLNSVGTILTMALFDMHGKYLCASLVFVSTLFPLVLPFIMIIPWVVFYVAALGWSYSYAVVVVLVHFSCHYVASTWVLIGFNNRTNRSNLDQDDSPPEDQFSGKREYVASLSMFFGLVTFGAKGIIIGPFLFCLALIIHKVYVNYRTIANEEITKRESRRRSSRSSRTSEVFSEAFIEEVNEINKNNQTSTPLPEPKALEHSTKPQVQHHQDLLSKPNLPPLPPSNHPSPQNKQSSPRRNSRPLIKRNTSTFFDLAQGLHNNLNALEKKKKKKASKENLLAALSPRRDKGHKSPRRSSLGVSKKVDKSEEVNSEDEEKYGKSEKQEKPKVEVSFLKQMREFKKMHKEGLITQEEHQELRQALLAKKMKGIKES